MEIFLRLLPILGLTILIEYPVVQILWLIIKKDEVSKLTFWEGRIIIIPAIIVNVLTNPALNLYAIDLFWNTQIPEKTIWAIITVLEVEIWIFEGVLYKYMLNTKWAKGLLLGVCANVLSYLASFLL